MSVFKSKFPTDLVISLTIVGDRPTEGSSGRSFGRLNCRTVRGKENSIITIYVCHGWRSKMAEGGDILWARSNRRSCRGATHPKEMVGEWIEVTSDEKADNKRRGGKSWSLVSWIGGVYKSKMATRITCRYQDVLLLIVLCIQKRGYRFIQIISQDCTYFGTWNWHMKAVPFTMNGTHQRELACAPNNQHNWPLPVCMWCIGFRRILPTERRALPIKGILQHKSKAITRLMDSLKKDEPPSRRASGSKHLRSTSLILGKPKIVSLSLTSAWCTLQGSRPVMANRTSVQDPVSVDTRWWARSWFKMSDLKFSDRSSLTADLSF